MRKLADKKQTIVEGVHLTKLVHGGQALGVLPSGQKVFIWNALPGERVNARIIKKKKNYLEAIATDILTVSPNRVMAVEPDSFLATSAWQILKDNSENEWKKKIVEELFANEKLTIDVVGCEAADISLGYRNKMEYVFFGDEEGLHLAQHMRGSHQKIIVKNIEIANEKINRMAADLMIELNKLSVRASDLKSLIIRSSKQGCVAALYTKCREFPAINLPKDLVGLGVYYSDPRSPASVITDVIIEKGNIELSDNVLGKHFSYDVHSFFQINLPVYELALSRIKEHVPAGKKIIDMYGGVGSIGISLSPKDLTVVDIDEHSAGYARKNLSANKIDGKVVCSSSEKALEEVTGDAILILDPPRAGLHPKLVNKVIEEDVKELVYLSCNPATQARDLKLLEDHYSFSSCYVFNFFPKTPHIETLVFLKKKK